MRQGSRQGLGGKSRSGVSVLSQLGLGRVSAAVSVRGICMESRLGLGRISAAVSVRGPDSSSAGNFGSDLGKG